MRTVARLTNEGDLKIAGALSERAPTVPGSAAYYPLDGTELPYGNDGPPITQRVNAAISPAGLQVPATGATFKFDLAPDLIHFDEGTMVVRFTPGPEFFTTSSWNRVMGHVAGAVNRNEIQVTRNGSGRNLACSISNDAGQINNSWGSCTSADLEEGREYHIVMRWNFTAMRMSLTVDGVKQEAPLYLYRPSVRGQLSLGYHPFTSRFANGSTLRDFQIFQRELTDEEMQADFQGKPSLTAGGDVFTRNFREGATGPRMRMGTTLQIGGSLVETATL